MAGPDCRFIGCEQLVATVRVASTCTVCGTFESDLRYCQYHYGRWAACVAGNLPDYDPQCKDCKAIGVGVIVLSEPIALRLAGV